MTNADTAPMDPEARLARLERELDSVKKDLMLTRAILMVAVCAGVVVTWVFHGPLGALLLLAVGCGTFIFVTAGKLLSAAIRSKQQ